MFKHTCLCVRRGAQTHAHMGVEGDLEGGAWGGIGGGGGARR